MLDRPAWVEVDCGCDVGVGVNVGCISEVWGRSYDVETMKMFNLMSGFM